MVNKVAKTRRLKSKYEEDNIEYCRGELNYTLRNPIKLDKVGLLFFIKYKIVLK